jgi:TolA-binding protein
MLEKANILLISNDPWEATFLYARVAKENAENPTGSLAKFRKAQLAYFTGNFEWALAQLDVLKGSTSKLIANDAFELSALISDNIESDSTGEQLKMYSRADFLIYAKKDSLAVLTLDSIATTFPTSTLIPNALYKVAGINYHKQDYAASTENLKEITDKYSVSTLNDNALFFWAEIENYKLNNHEKAMELYKRILTECKGSYFTSESREQYRILRGDFKEKEDFFNNTKS